MKVTSNGYQYPSNHKVERDTVKDCILLINNERYKANKHISSMWWGQHLVIMVVPVLFWFVLFSSLIVILKTLQDLHMKIFSLQYDFYILTSLIA